MRFVQHLFATEQFEEESVQDNKASGEWYERYIISLMVNEPPANPYHAADSDHGRAAFAGRRAEFGRLYRQLTDPAHQSALLFTGWRRCGKTAFLRAFDTAFGSTFVGAYVGLADALIDPPFESGSPSVNMETALALALAQGVTAALMERSFPLSRFRALPPPPDEQARFWFAQVFLPAALTVIHRERLLVLLLDDADRLVNVMRSGRLSGEVIPFLRDLVRTTPQLGIALTMGLEYEDDFSALSPLISPNETVRLSALSLEETTTLLQDPTRPYFTVPDEITAAVYKATGGAPALVQHYGYHMFRRWLNAPELNVITLDDVKAITQHVYRYAEDDFRHAWTRLPANERLVLTAISGLLYEDPLGRVDATDIEAWLVETDYPLDLVSIYAALRGLEYREVITPGASGITLRAAIMQTWLLENARLTKRLVPIQERLAPSREPLTGGERRRVPLMAMIAVGIVLGLIVGVIAVAVINSGGRQGTTLPAPTITLNPP